MTSAARTAMFGAVGGIHTATEERGLRNRTRRDVLVRWLPPVVG